MKLIKDYYTGLIPFYTIFLLYMMLYGCGREAGEIGNLQLVPFRSIQHFLLPQIPFGKFFMNIICNIVVFIPFGWLGLSIKPLKNIFLLLPLYILGIISIELTQHFTGRGMADIDDVILNTLGMLSGYFILWIFEKGFAKSGHSIA